MSPTTPFPTYLLPTLPFPFPSPVYSIFRRNSSVSTSSTSTTTTDTFSTTSSTRRLLPSTTTSPSYLRCVCCGTHLVLASQIISKGFTGRHGRAYLVSASCTTPFTFPQPATPTPSLAPPTDLANTR